MLGEYRDTMDLWLVEVKHIYDDSYEVLGIFELESDIIVAKKLYLSNKENIGLRSEEFAFRESKYALGTIYY